MSKSNLTGYPSIDKPWLKYYAKEVIAAPLPECNLYQYIYENNKKFPKDIALSYYGSKMIYSQFFAVTQDVAKALTAFGVKEGDKVTVCMASTPEAVCLIYALNLIGAIPNLLDPRYNENGLAYCMEESPSELLVTIDSSYEKFLNIGRPVCPEKVVIVSPFLSIPPMLKLLVSLKVKAIKPREGHYTWQEFLKAGKKTDYCPARYTNNQLAAILHTGGTTGNPKGVMLSNDSINAIAHQYKMLVNPKRGETLLDIIPPFASYGLCASIHMPLSLGVSVELIPKFEAAAFGDLLLKHKPTYVMGVPSFWESLMVNPKMEKADLSWLLSAACGGDSMSVATESQLNTFFAEHNSKAQIDSGYGMSEMSATACVCYGNAHRPGSVGIPLINTVFKVIDPDTYEECAYDTQGEICISGPGMMLGYLNNEELTAQTIKKHADGKLWVHTGDIGHITPEGYVYHDGRIKRMIVRFDGFKIYPAAVEQVVLKHNAVLNCAVVAFNKTGVGIMPKAFVSLKDAAADTASIKKELIAMCKAELAERSVPEDVEFLNELPLTSIGKVDYRALEKR